MKSPIQFAAEPTEVPTPRTFNGNISLIIIQQIGPQETAKPMMKIAMKIMVITAEIILLVPRVRLG